MLFDSLYYPYPSRRMVTYSNRSMVATSQALAAQAGLEILKKVGMQLMRHRHCSSSDGGGTHFKWSG